jgi:hypothetical protein
MNEITKKVFTESKKSVGFLMGLISIIGLMWICQHNIETLNYIIPLTMLIIAGYLISQGSVDLSFVLKNVTVKEGFTESKKAIGFFLGIAATYIVTILFKGNLEVIKAGEPYILILSLGFMGVQGILDYLNTIKNYTFMKPKEGDDNAKPAE